LIYASLVGVIIIHFALFRKRGLLDPISVFFVVFLYYCYFAPITMLAFDQFGVWVLEQTIWISMETIQKAAEVYFIGYASYASAYYLMSRGENFNQYMPNNWNIYTILNDRYVRVILLIVFLISFVMIVFFRSVISEITSSYEGKISGNYSSSTFGFLINLLFTLISFFVNYLILNSRNFLVIAIASVLFFILLATLTFSKTPFVYATLCLFCSLYRFKKLPYFATMSVLILSAILGSVYLIPAFSVFRASGEFVLAAPSADTLGRMLSEAASPFTIMHFAVHGYVSADGHPLWQSFVLWIPRVLWPERPLDIAEAFAQQVIVNWQPGFGLGFSPLAEAYVRYGTYGSSFLMLLLGGLTALLQSFFSRFLPGPMRVPAIMTVGGLVAVFVLRGAFSGLLTQGLQIWIPLVLVGLVARQFSVPFLGK
jgi:O-antigen polysaccharide polymerase Wzy